MRHKFLALSALGPVAAEVVQQPSSTAGEEVNNKEDSSNGFVCGEGCSFRVDQENKIAEIWVFGTIYGVGIYMKAITMMNSLTSDFTLHIYIHSPGGSIATGCIFISSMQRCKAKTVTHNLGLAASCGSLILAFGDKIHIDPITNTMFHNALSGGYDSVHRVISKNQHLTKNVNNFFEMMKKRGIVTEDEVEAITKRGEEFYLTSEIMIPRIKEAGLWYEGV